MNLIPIPTAISEAKGRFEQDLKGQDLNLFLQSFGNSMLFFNELKRELKTSVLNAKGEKDQVDVDLEADIMRQLRDQGVVSE
ncbi:MAG: hypothetical protein ABIQ57_09510 [Candidatus Kapaibacterium sp.]